MDAKKVEDLITKIKALRAKAEDKSVGPDEAALFASKVQELLEKYNLSEEVLEEFQKTGQAFGEDTLKTPYGAVPWQYKLATFVARFYYCEMHRETYKDILDKSRYQFVFVGLAHNRVVALEMFDYLQKTVSRLARDYSDRKTERYSFEQGCAMSICFRLIEERKQRDSSKNALIPVPPPQQSNGRKSKEVSFRDDTAIGFKAGENVNLSDKVVGSTERKKLK